MTEIEDKLAMLKTKMALLSSTMSEEKKNKIDPTRKDRMAKGISDAERIKEINDRLDNGDFYVSISNGV